MARCTQTVQGTQLPQTDWREFLEPILHSNRNESGIILCMCTYNHDKAWYSYSTSIFHTGYIAVHVPRITKLFGDKIIYFHKFQKFNETMEVHVHVFVI